MRSRIANSLERANQESESTVMRSETGRSLTARVTEVRGVQAPLRAIRWALSIGNLSDRPWSMVGAHADVVLDHTRAARAVPVRMSVTPAEPFMVIPGEHRPGEVVAPMSTAVLRAINDGRGGGDVTYALTITAVVAPVLAEKSGALGVPWKINIVEHDYDSAVKGVIPQSSWVDMMRVLGWDETELVEMPVGRLRGRFPRAYEAYIEATEHHRRGNWRKCLASCREVFEAMAWTQMPKGSTTVDMTALRGLFDPSSKGDKLDQVVKVFGEYLHLGRHAQSEDVGIEITRSDSMLALHLTAGVLRHLA